MHVEQHKWFFSVIFKYSYFFIGLLNIFSSPDKKSAKRSGVTRARFQLHILGKTNSIEPII
jgi:hypothetical protein